MGKCMVSLVNSQWHLWEIDLRFAFNSTPGFAINLGVAGVAVGVEAERGFAPRLLDLILREGGG